MLVIAFTEAYPLINNKTIHLIKKGAILINTARGGLKNHVLLHRENVIYTPHMAFYSREAVQRILDTTAENIRSFIDGKISNPVFQKC